MERRILGEWQAASDEERATPLLFINRIVYRTHWYRPSKEDGHQVVAAIVRRAGDL
jgi:hypothetical protein